MRPMVKAAKWKRGGQSMRGDRCAAILLVLLTSACSTADRPAVDQGPPQDEAHSTPRRQPVDEPPARASQVYEAVLRRYLSQDAPGFTVEGHRPPVVYVVDDAVTSAADPTATGRGGGGEKIPPAVQAAVTRGLADIARIRWADHREDVVVETADCPHVRGSGLVVTLSPVPRDGDPVDVGVGGFAACLAASWLTYVVEANESGWSVSGTTGPISMS